MKAIGAGIQKKEYVEAVNGYWMYQDGTSRWGTGVFKNNEKPIEITSELHVKPIDEKIAWYLEQKKAEKKEVNQGLTFTKECGNLS